ncbi:MAG: hypothetical protein QXQ87_01305, partial [Halobacteria archaeon]
MVGRLLPALVLLLLVSTPLRADPTVLSYSLDPDFAVYGPDVQVKVRAQIAGGQPQAYQLFLASELVFRDWKNKVDGQPWVGSGGDLAAPFAIDVPAQASTITISLNGSTPNQARTEPRTLFRAEWKDGAGVVREL